MDINPSLAVLATPDPERFESFRQGLAGAGIKLVPVRSGAAVLALAKERRPGLCILDEGLPDYAPLELAGVLVRMDAWINTAVISSLPEEDFHALSEGLGVLARVSPCPGHDEGRELAAKSHALQLRAAAQ